MLAEIGLAILGLTIWIIIIIVAIIVIVFVGILIWAFICDVLKMILNIVLGIPLFVLGLGWSILNLLSLGLLAKITGRGAFFCKLEDCPSCGGIKTVREYSKCIESHTIHGGCGTDKNGQTICVPSEVVCDKHERGKFCTRRKCNYKVIEEIY